MLSLLLTVAMLATAQQIPLPPLPNKLLGVVTNKKPLVFNERGEFKVVSFSDMHMGERWGNQTYADWGDTNDNKTQEVHRIVLDQEKPDFVVFNGDLMTGENVFKENATNYLDKVVQPTVERGIPFASAHGNHDNAVNITHEIEIDYESKKYDLSYTRSDAGLKPYGGGNYWVPVYATTPPKWFWYNTKPALLLWFLDSRSFVSGHGAGPGPVPAEADYYWVDENTVPRYIASQAELMKKEWGSIPPSLVFVHIPFQKALDLYFLPTEGNHDDEPDPSVQGFNSNGYTGLDSPTWTEIVKLDQGKNRVLAVTSGHDHGENWCARSVNTTGVTVCFQGHSGYGGYVTANSGVRNGRVFQMNLKDLNGEYASAKTWTSFENKTIANELILSRDYMKEYV